jgi:uncharacterized phage protein (TIGR01671 family)
VREIKFRAWDEKWKRWIAPRDISIYGDGTQYFDRRSDPDGDVIETAVEGQCALMQYTGLKDKNGREIYEGDVFGLCDPEDQSVFTLVFQDGSFRKGYKRWNPKIPFLPLDDWDMDNFQVIGNIYENPELLK